MYKSKELVEEDERKRKEKGIATEEPQNKKRVNDEETVKFINTLKRSEYSVVE